MQGLAFGGASSSLAFASAAAIAAFAARLATAVCTVATALIKFSVASGEFWGAICKLDNVIESVIGFECHMKARPLPDGVCPFCASSWVSCVHWMLGLISFAITGLQVK